MDGSMKAMALVEIGKPLEEIELDDPIPADNEVILEVTACGVCQTDLKIISGVHPTIKRLKKLPHVMGHEIAGVVRETGSNVKDWQIGDRAVVSFYIGCGTCKFCHTGRTPLCTNLQDSIGFTCNGGFAEKVKVPANNLVRISSKIPDEEAAIIPDAIGTAVHAVIDRGEVRVGERVLILGAGGVGLHALQVIRMCGAYTIVADIDNRKLELAKQFGADETVFANKENAALIKVDKIFETSGALCDNMWLLDCLERGGTIITVGYRVDATMKIDVMSLVSNEYVIKGSRACAITSVQAAVDMVERGLLKPIVSVRYPFSQANEALADLAAGKIDGRAVLCRTL